MNINFYLNNIYTFKEQKLIKLMAISGLLKFILFCSIGAFISSAIGSFFYDITLNINFSGIMGIIFGSITNYVLNLKFTWKFSS